MKFFKPLTGEPREQLHHQPNTLGERTHASQASFDKWGRIWTMRQEEHHEFTLPSCHHKDALHVVYTTGRFLRVLYGSCTTWNHRYRCKRKWAKLSGCQAILSLLHICAFSNVKIRTLVYIVNGLPDFLSCSLHAKNYGSSLSIALAV